MCIHNCALSFIVAHAYIIAHSHTFSWNAICTGKTLRLPRLRKDGSPGSVRALLPALPPAPSLSRLPSSSSIFTVIASKKITLQKERLDLLARVRKPTKANKRKQKTRTPTL